MLYYIHKEQKGANKMEKVICLTTLNAAIEAACDNLRNNLGWTDDQCLEFAANLMENLARDGWKVKEE
jgi:hypothetical protein